MNKLSLFLTLLFLGVLFPNIVFAACDRETYNCDDPNSMTTEEITRAIADGSVDVSQIDSAKLASSMEDPRVLDKVDEAAKENPTILNDNPEVMQKWAESLGFEISTGNRVDSYDGNSIGIVGNPHSSSFDPSYLTSVVGASNIVVNPDGTVSYDLGSKEILFSGEIKPVEVIVGGSQGKITEVNEVYSITQGFIEINGIRFDSEGQIQINRDGGDVIVGATFSPIEITQSGNLIGTLDRWSRVELEGQDIVLLQGSKYTIENGVAKGTIIQTQGGVQVQVSGDCSSSRLNCLGEEVISANRLIPEERKSVLFVREDQSIQGEERRVGINVFLPDGAGSSSQVNVVEVQREEGVNLGVEIIALSNKINPNSGQREQVAIYSFNDAVLRSSESMRLPEGLTIDLNGFRKDDQGVSTEFKSTYITNNQYMYQLLSSTPQEEKYYLAARDLYRISPVDLATSLAGIEENLERLSVDSSDTASLILLQSHLRDLNILDASGNLNPNFFSREYLEFVSEGGVYEDREIFEQNRNSAVTTEIIGSVLFTVAKTFVTGGGSLVVDAITTGASAAYAYNKGQTLFDNFVKNPSIDFYLENTEDLGAFIATAVNRGNIVVADLGTPSSPVVTSPALPVLVAQNNPNNNPSSISVSPIGNSKQTP